jgi:hypothetical protein
VTEKAIELYEAIAADPNYALAYVGIGYLLSFIAGGRPGIVIPRPKRRAKALAGDSPG